MNNFYANFVSVAVNNYADVHSDTYLQMSASQKSDTIWSNIMTDTSSQNWYSFAAFAGIYQEDMGLSFETIGDEMPVSWSNHVRDKYIHSIGTIAKAEWKVTNSNGYTGMFEGAKNCYVRLSLAHQPNPN
jgi:hypothetical protein